VAPLVTALTGHIARKQANRVEPASGRLDPPLTTRSMAADRPIPWTVRQIWAATT
jgi:hypothetical protein